jgi:ketosteroid isomerase-like protein
MENSMTTRELLETYYKGLAKKRGWETVIADDFKFIGGDMTKTTPVVGKQAYVEVINRFSKWFTDMRAKNVFVSDDGAFVSANYDYTFPNGKSINANVAELWKVKNGKLDMLTIFFDTANFDAFLKG